MTLSQLRAKAREQLGNSIFSEKWLLVLLGTLLAGAVLGISSFVSFLVYGAVAVGLSAMTLRLVRDPASPVRLDDLLYGFVGGRFGRSFVTGFLTAIYTALWSLLFVIPGIVKGYSYAMAFYVSLDHPEMSANDCITESRRMMDGQKMRLFLLDLSFIGWYIVGALCFGIGTLWVDAYRQMARANFYEELCTTLGTVSAAPSAGDTTVG